MTELSVLVGQKKAGALSRFAAEYIFNYDTTVNQDAFISLTMPVRAKSYVLPRLLPIFEMHLPEGYLLSVIKKHFSKLTNTDDFGLLTLLAPSVHGRLHYISTNITKEVIALDDLLNPASDQLFQSLLTRFALHSPISGVQPKVLARVENKATLKLEDVIIKAWGEDYPELALNEYLCMKAVASSGVSVPDFYLSSDDKLFIMKRFDIVDECEKPRTYLGFEDMCVLQAKSRDDKYQGSYEQLAKSIKLFVASTVKQQALQQFFKMMVLNNLLQNGDAHLKNFGVLYSSVQDVSLAPAYDIVSTTVYIQKDVPALTLAGSKRWHDKQVLLRFGVQTCELTPKEARLLYDDCIKGVLSIQAEIEQRLKQTTDINKQKLLQHLFILVQQASNH